MPDDDVKVLMPRDSHETAPFIEVSVYRFSRCCVLPCHAKSPFLFAKRDNRPGPISTVGKWRLALRGIDDEGQRGSSRNANERKKR